jgi:peptidoglycan/LPS O-acetylase OafA/YrhL
MMVEMIFYVCMILLFTTKTLQHIEFLGLAFLAILVPINSTFIVTNYPTYHRAIVFWFPLVVYFPLFFSGIIFYRIKFIKPTLFRYVLIALSFVIQCWLFREGFRRTFTLSQAEYSVMLFVWYVFFIFYVNNILGFLVNKITVFLGTVSFSLYLVHQFIGLHVLIPFFEKTLKLNTFLSLILSLSLVLIIAYLIMKCVEKPSMNYVRNRYKAIKLQKSIQ